MTANGKMSRLEDSGFQFGNISLKIPLSSASSFSYRRGSVQRGRSVEFRIISLTGLFVHLFRHGFPVQLPDAQQISVHFMPRGVTRIRAVGSTAEMFPLADLVAEDREISAQVFDRLQGLIHDVN
jgi:hypothetical protein